MLWPRWSWTIVSPFRMRMTWPLVDRWCHLFAMKQCPHLRTIKIHKVNFMCSAIELPFQRTRLDSNQWSHYFWLLFKWLGRQDSNLQLISRVVNSHLPYHWAHSRMKLVGREGVEPSTCCVSDNRSHQLSYRPSLKLALPLRLELRFPHWERGELASYSMEAYGNWYLQWDSNPQPSD